MSLLVTGMAAFVLGFTMVFILRSQSSTSRKNAYDLDNIKRLYEKLRAENTELSYRLSRVIDSYNNDNYDGFSDVRSQNRIMRFLQESERELEDKISFQTSLLFDMRNSVKEIEDKTIDYNYVEKIITRALHNENLKDNGNDEVGLTDDENLRKLTASYATKIDDIEAIVSNILHVTRTPISGLKIISKTISNSTDDTAIQDKCKKLDEYADMIERGISTLSIKPVINDNETENIYDRIQYDCTLIGLTSNKKINFEYIFPNEQFVIPVDKANCLMACVNCILENAMYYSKDNGKIIIELAVNEDIAELSVTNYGEPIDQNDIDKVFIRGYSGRGSSGYGLSLAKHIAEDYLNGDITVQNIDEGGVKFTISIRDLL